MNHIYWTSYLSDEMLTWVNPIKDKLVFEFENMKKELETRLKLILDSCNTADRKEIALRICKEPHKSALFAMLDNKCNDKFIWDIVKPTSKVYFNNIVDED